MEVITKVFLIVFSALIGYLVREYQNRISPFTKILGIGGNVFNSKREIEFDEKIISEFNKIDFFVPIVGDIILNDLSEGKKQISTFQVNQPKFVEIIDSINKKLDKNEDYHNELIKLLSIDYFQRSLRKLLYENKIVCNKIEIDKSKIQVPFIRNKDDDGEVIFEFPNKRIRFGSDFDSYEYIYKLLEPFIVAISQDDRTFLKDILSQFKKYVEKTNNNLSYYYDKFDETLNNYSQWFLLMYIANTSTKPFILANKGKLYIENTKTKAKINEDCYLVDFGFNNDGEKVINDCPNDIVLKPGESHKYYVATNKTQNEMDSGLSLRDTFDNKVGKAKISLPVYKIGLLRKFNLKIKNIKFENTGLEI